MRVGEKQRKESSFLLQFRFMCFVVVKELPNIVVFSFYLVSLKKGALNNQITLPKNREKLTCNLFGSLI